MRRGYLMRCAAALTGRSHVLRRCMLRARSGGMLLWRDALSTRSGRVLDALWRGSTFRGSPCNTGRGRVMRSRHVAPLRGMRLVLSLGRTIRMGRTLGMNRTLAGNTGIVARRGSGGTMNATWRRTGGATFGRRG